MSLGRVEFDIVDLVKYSTALGARIDQVPFALATAMNRSVDITRDFLVKVTWPTAIDARNPSFIAASLTTRQAKASKTSLSVEIYDRLNRGNLLMHATGGTRTPLGGGSLAVPSSKIPKGARGVPKRLRPKNLKNSFKRNGMLFTRDKKGKVTLVYALKKATVIPKSVPFYEDFAVSMAREMRRTIPLAVAKAMKTAR
jgi:hypothetical protein